MNAARLDLDNWEWLLMKNKDGGTVLLIPRSSNVTLSDLDALPHIFEVVRVADEGIWLKMVEA